jgi:hypothetical protein
MFHVFCAKGFPVGLDAAARAIGSGKSAGVDGSLAPILWRDGKHPQVLEYVAQDCRVTLNVALKSEERRTFSWINKKGATSSLDLRRGWLTVKEAMALPLPDTSWMDNPLQRSKFTRWLG